MKAVILLGSLLSLTAFAGSIEPRYEGIYEITYRCPGPASACDKLGKKSTLLIAAGAPSAVDPFGLSLMVRHPTIEMAKYLFFANRIQGDLTIRGAQSGQGEIEVQIDPQTLRLTGAIRSPRYDGDVAIDGVQTVTLGSVTTGISQLGIQDLAGNYSDPRGRGTLALRVGFSGKLMGAYRVAGMGVILPFDFVELDQKSGLITLIYSKSDGSTVKWMLGANLNSKGRLSLTGWSLATTSGGASRKTFVKD